MKNGNAIRYLDADDVEKLALLRAKLAKLGKVESKLEKKIKEKMGAGYRCPKSTPWLLEFLKVAQTRVDWKEHLFGVLLQRVYRGDKEATAKHLVRIERHTDPVIVKKILVKANPFYESRKRAAA